MLLNMDEMIKRAHQLFYAGNSRESIARKLNAEFHGASYVATARWAEAVLVSGWWPSDTGAVYKTKIIL